MQLPKGQHSILAFFPSSSKAQKAVNALQSAGLVNDSESIQLDRTSRYGSSNDAEYNNPINNASTLSGLTIHSNGGGTDEGANPLLAASDSASGMSSSGMAGGQAFMVTLVTKESNVEKAVSIIKSHGGQV